MQQRTQPPPRSIACVTSSVRGVPRFRTRGAFYRQQATFEWLPGQAFLIQRWEAESPFPRPASRSSGPPRTARDLSSTISTSAASSANIRWSSQGRRLEASAECVHARFLPALRRHVERKRLGHRRPPGAQRQWLDLGPRLRDDVPPAAVDHLRGRGVRPARACPAAAARARGRGRLPRRGRSPPAWRTPAPGGT